MAVNEQFYRNPALAKHNPKNDNPNHAIFCVSSQANIPPQINPTLSINHPAHITTPITTIVTAVENINMNIVALLLN